jgi:hypothetical protein
LQNERFWGDGNKWIKTLLSFHGFPTPVADISSILGKRLRNTVNLLLVLPLNFESKRNVNRTTDY